MITHNELVHNFIASAIIKERLGVSLGSLSAGDLLLYAGFLPGSEELTACTVGELLQAARARERADRAQEEEEDGRARGGSGMGADMVLGAGGSVELECVGVDEAGDDVRLPPLRVPRVTAKGLGLGLGLGVTAKAAGRQAGAAKAGAESTAERGQGQGESVAMEGQEDSGAGSSTSSATNSTGSGSGEDAPPVPASSLWRGVLSDVHARTKDAYRRSVDLGLGGVRRGLAALGARLAALGGEGVEDDEGHGEAEEGGAEGGTVEEK